MTTRRRRIWLVALTAAYLIAVVVVGFWQTPVDAPADGSIDSWLAVLHTRGVPASFDYAALEFTANVLFFVPIGLLMALLLRARFWFVAVVIGVLGSGAIELGQLLFLPGRYASWRDIEANSIGTVIGVAIALLARGTARLSRSRRATSGPR